MDLRPAAGASNSAAVVAVLQVDLGLIQRDPDAVSSREALFLTPELNVTY